MEALYRRDACCGGIETFRATWGSSAIVNQAWAKQAAEAYDNFEFHWCANHLLPPWAREIHYETCERHLLDRGWRQFRHVGWAVFAALYVEAGKR